MTSKPHFVKFTSLIAVSKAVTKSRSGGVGWTGGAVDWVREDSNPTKVDKANYALVRDVDSNVLELTNDAQKALNFPNPQVRKIISIYKLLTSESSKSNWKHYSSCSEPCCAP